MKTNSKQDKSRIIKDLVKLGIPYANSYRIANESTGMAAVALVKLIRDLHERGVIVVRG